MTLPGERANPVRSVTRFPNRVPQVRILPGALSASGEDSHLINKNTGQVGVFSCAAVSRWLSVQATVRGQEVSTARGWLRDERGPPSVDQAWRYQHRSMRSRHVSSKP